MLRPRSRLGRDRQGLVALEFALVAPLMITVMAATYDVTQVLAAQSRMNAAALAIAETATNMVAANMAQTPPNPPDPTNPAGRNAITGDQAENAAGAAFLYMPGWLGMNQGRFAVTVSAMNMVGPVATLAWSAALSKGAPALRSCGVTLPSPPNPPSRGTLPAALLTGGTPLLVVDVSYTYQPLFLGFVAPGFPILRSIPMPPRAAGTVIAPSYVSSADIPATDYVRC